MPHLGDAVPSGRAGGTSDGAIDGAMTVGNRGSGTLRPLATHLTLEELVYRELRGGIAAGRFRPGERISANATAEALGVSRLPVIHAMRRLSSEGFVRIRPHRTVVVADPSIDEIRGSYLITAELEALAARLALANLSDEDILPLHDAPAVRARRRARSTVTGWDTQDHAFHARLWESSGVTQLTALLQTLWDQAAYYRSLFSSEDFADERAREHERILDAIRQRDADALSEAIREHRLAGARRVERYLQARATAPQATAPGMSKARDLGAPIGKSVHRRRARHGGPDAEPKAGAAEVSERATTPVTE